MKTTEFLAKLKAIPKEDLINIKGIGSVLADNIIEFGDSNEFKVLYDKFQNLETRNMGLDIVVKEKKPPVDGELSGETICITGTFDISRIEIKGRLENIGAKVVDSVTKNTTILLAGENAGSKLAKAQKLGIRVVENLGELNV